jgi:hypothetical protein
MTISATGDQRREEYVRKVLRQNAKSFRMQDEALIKRTILSNLGQKWDTIIAEQAMASGVAATAKMFGLEMRTVESVRASELRRARRDGAT